MPSSTRIRRPGRTAAAAETGLLDTSVVIDLDAIDPSSLPLGAAISAVTLAELAIGPLAVGDPVERARRQDKLQRAESSFEALPFDVAAARSYGRLFAALASGRKPRGRRGFDLLIAATALSAELPLYTRNPRDFAGLEELIEIVPV